MQEQLKGVITSDEGDGVAHDSRFREDGEFVQLLTKAQLPLLRYITSLVGDPHIASNLLQETNLGLWKKQSDFEFGTSFEAWATRFAYWEVRAYLRDRSRDRHVFGEELVSQLSDRKIAASETDDFEATMQTLRECVKKLQGSHRSVVSLRYNDGLSIQMISGRLGKSPSAVKGALLRARRSLRRCMERSQVGAPPDR